MPFFDRATGSEVDPAHVRSGLVDERGRPVYSADEEWNEAIHWAIRGFRLRAILRGALPRNEDGLLLKRSIWEVG